MALITMLLKKYLKIIIFFNLQIKNFRIEIIDSKVSLSLSILKIDFSKHPHQLHYEFLSETGLFGYFSFLLFIFLSLY